MSVTRIGAVGYLNARPLTEGLAERDRLDVRFDVPSVCARLLHEGVVDVGLVPAIEVLNGDYAIASGLAVASEGEVASVALFTRVALDRVRSIAVDVSSRTSAALTRVLCREAFRIAPAFVPHVPDLRAMLAVHDAALLIGDPALDADAAAVGASKIDLGAAWTVLTGLPFVWAVWAGRREAMTPAVTGELRAARVRGVQARDRIADAAASGDVMRAARYRRYLRENIQYDMGPRHVSALQRFFASAAEVGVVTTTRALVFADEAGHRVAERGDVA